MREVGAEGVGRGEMPAGERAQVHRQARHWQGFAMVRMGTKMTTVGIIGCGFVGGALKTWLEEHI